MKTLVPFLLSFAMVVGSFALVVGMSTVAFAEEKPKHPDVPDKMHVAVQDVERGLSFELQPNGKVELNITEEMNGKKSEKSYKADSMAAFRKDYPQIAEKYQIDRFIPRRIWEPFELGPSSTDWQNWKNWFQDDWFWDNPEHSGFMEKWMDKFDSDEVSNWLDEQRKLFKDFRELSMPTTKVDSSSSNSGNHEIGLTVGALDNVLADQLQLDPHRCVVVLKVRPGSLAEKDGIKKNDIILKLDGKQLSDREQFRADLRRLAGKEFKLEIMRKGKDETVTMKPAA